MHLLGVNKVQKCTFKKKRLDLFSESVIFVIELFQNVFCDNFLDYSLDFNALKRHS